MSFWDDEDDEQAAPPVASGFWDDEAPAAEAAPAAPAPPPAPSADDAPWYASLLGGAAEGLTLGATNHVPGGRSFNEWAERSNPGIYGAADTATTVANPTNLLPGGLAARAAIGAGASGVRTLAETGEAEDAGWDALLTGGVGLGLGAAAKPLAKAGNWVAGKGADALEATGLRNRVAAVGMYGGQLKRLAQNKGREYIQELGGAIEDAGIHKGDGLLGWLPQPAETYGANARVLKQGAARGLEAGEARLADVQVPIDDVVGALDEQAMRGADKIGSSGRQQQRIARDMQGDIIDRANAYDDQALPFGEALKIRRGLDEDVNWARLGGAAESPIHEEVSRAAVGKLRGNIDSALDAPGVDEEAAALWRKSRGDYEHASDVLKPAEAREFQEAGNQVISLPAWMSLAGGAAIGGGSGAASGDSWDDGLTGALAGAAGAQLLKSRGRSAIAGTLKTAAQAARHGGSALHLGAEGLEGLAPMYGLAVEETLDEDPWDALLNRRRY